MVGPWVSVCSASTLALLVLLFLEFALAEVFLVLLLSFDDFLTLVVQVMKSVPVEGFLAIVLAGFTGAHAARDVGLTAITSLIAVSDTGNGTHTNVFVDEVVSGELVEDFSVLERIVVFFFSLLLALLDALELTSYNHVHGLEDLYHIRWFLLEDGVFGQDAELGEDPLAPSADLIVHDVDLLEALIELGQLTGSLVDLIVHRHDFRVRNIRG